MTVPQQFSKEQIKKMKRALPKLIRTRGAAKTDGFLVRMFGKERLPEIKELYEMSGNSVARMLQHDELIKGWALLEKLRQEMSEHEVVGDNIPKQYDKIQKNMISLMDKIRRQEEGVKIQAEITHDMDRLRDVIDVQEAKVQDAKIIEQDREAVRRSSLFKNSFV